MLVRLRWNTLRKISYTTIRQPPMVTNATGVVQFILHRHLPSIYYRWGQTRTSWANSLFEDNAEYGMGIVMAENNATRIVRLMNEAIANNCCSDELKDLFKMDWQPLTEILHWNYWRSPRYLKRVNVIVQTNSWIEPLPDKTFTMDHWGRLGLRHRFRWFRPRYCFGKNLNILVLDTEVYSNTGGQASKSTPIGA